MTVKIGSKIVCPACKTTQILGSEAKQAVCEACGEALFPGRAFELTADHFNDFALADAPLLIDFWAEWCGPCQTMGPIFEEMAAEFAGLVQFAKVNTDQQKALTQYFRIQTIPTLALVHRQKDVSRKVGLATRRELRSWIFEGLSRGTET